jgi:hypothetical protein
VTLIPSIGRMQPGDHYCGIYKSDEDHRALVVDFIRQGVAAGEKIVYVVNLETAAQLKAMLAAAALDIESLIARGQLVILTARDVYLRDGEFDPDKMLARLREETDAALAQGYPALRITGEMTWALDGEPGSERLVEYEAKLNHFYPGSKCVGMCQYDRRQFDAELLLDVIHTHPRVLYGREALDNSCMYFVPPDALLGDRQAGVLDRWLSNLSDRHGRG